MILRPSSSKALWRATTHRRGWVLRLRPCHAGVVAAFGPLECVVLAGPPSAASSRSAIELSDVAAPRFVALSRLAVNCPQSRTMTRSSRQAYWPSACHNGAGIRKRPNCARFWRDSTMGRPVARTRENPDSNNCRSAEPGIAFQTTLPAPLLGYHSAPDRHRPRKFMNNPDSSTMFAHIVIVNPSRLMRLEVLRSSS